MRLSVILDHLLANLGNFSEVFFFESEVCFCLSVERRVRSDCFLAYSQTHPMRYWKRKVENTGGSYACWTVGVLCVGFPVPTFLNPKALTMLTVILKLRTSVSISTDILWAFRCWWNRPYYRVAFPLSGNQQTTQLETCFPIMLQSLNFCLMQSSNETRNFAINGLGIELPAKEDKG